MKKSRIAKLALMGASITALAATLTTSTYAWYVSNKQADITGGSGSTGAAGSDGSVLVAWTDGPETYFKSIDFAEDTDATRNALDPIHFTDDFYGIKSDGTRSDAASTAFIKFDVYVKTGSGVPVTPKINISVTGSNSQVAYVPTSGWYQAKVFDTADATNYLVKKEVYDPANGVTAENFGAKTYYTKSGDTYTVAAEYVQSTTYYTQSIDYVKPQTAPTADNFASDEYYLEYANALPSDKEKGQTFTIEPLKAIWVQQVIAGDDTPTYFSPDTTPSGADAHAYYAAVTGYKPWANTTEKSGLEVIPTTAGKGKKVTYTIYLDGGDKDCFNSCAGYDINFDLTFSVE